MQVHVDKKLSYRYQKVVLGEMNPIQSLSYSVCPKDQSWVRCSSVSILMV